MDVQKTMVLALDPFHGSLLRRLLSDHAGDELLARGYTSAEMTAWMDMLIKLES